MEKLKDDPESRIRCKTGGSTVEDGCDEDRRTVGKGPGDDENQMFR